jgi:hypothetical protein
MAAPHIKPRLRLRLALLLLLLATLLLSGVPHAEGARMGVPMPGSRCESAVAVPAV